MNPAMTDKPFERKAFILAGTTAVGKTAVAHYIARREGWAILSADAMLVYRGMDIGTAKPSLAERSEVSYGGIDLVSPDESFSVGDYLDHARSFLAPLSPTQPVIVVGGTGLYIKALLQGLDPMPPVDLAIRREVESLYEVEGLEGLCRACATADPKRYAALADRSNPRRVMRALELARMGVPFSPSWQTPSKHFEGLVQLCMNRASLDEQIRMRVERMFSAGLLDEVASLVRQYPNWSRTARSAIGYREALALYRGECSEPEAREAIAQRTRRYARRQETWFRHQLPFHTITRETSTSMDVLADRVLSIWRQYGPCNIRL